ncbi:MAG TPA: nucleoside triphosphate pyrophosphohydrolase family protein [Anaerolineales bacterium]|nr:nucleoside triphosphate pyrophosphohydrolase family protein [Anaerolineales bacterium]
MTQKIDLNKYTEFVKGVTSTPTEDPETFVERFRELNGFEGGIGINPSLLLNAAIGLGSEAGEFHEIVKKMFFQGKKMSAENHFHLKRELGDIIWYWTNACRSLGLDPNDVIQENVTKLEARYPGGHFDAHYSENRKAGDL